MLDKNIILILEHHFNLFFELFIFHIDYVFRCFVLSLLMPTCEGSSPWHHFMNYFKWMFRHKKNLDIYVVAFYFSKKIGLLQPDKIMVLNSHNLITNKPHKFEEILRVKKCEILPLVIS